MKRGCELGVALAGDLQPPEGRLAYGTLDDGGRMGRKGEQNAVGAVSCEGFIKNACILIKS